jgi:copper(I)-binding protein
MKPVKSLPALAATPGPMLAAMLAPMLMVAACHRGPARARVRIERAWVRLPAIPGGEGAGYLTARSDTADRLLAVSAPGARITLHRTMSAGAMTMMQPLASVALPAGEKIAFAPGGYHLMITGLDPGLKRHDRLALTFRFQTTPPVTVRAPLVGPGESAPGDGD